MLGAMVLALYVLLWILAVVSALRLHGVFDVYAFVGNYWPWHSDNFRNPRNIGTAFVLVAGFLSTRLWMLASKKHVAHIFADMPAAGARVIFGGHAFLYIVVGLYLVIAAKLPIVAATIQLLSMILLGLWFRNHPVQPATEV